jgi:hypothetical protein
MSEAAPEWIESWVNYLNEARMDEELFASVSTTGSWYVAAREEREGKADTLEAGKLAALGAMAGLVPWHREWRAKFAGHELLIVELEEWERENPTLPFAWTFAMPWPYRESGDAETIESAKAAVLRAARAHERRHAP